MKEDIKICNIRKCGYIILNIALFCIMACVMSTIVFSIFSLSSLGWGIGAQFAIAFILTGLIYPLNLSKRIYSRTVGLTLEG